MTSPYQMGKESFAKYRACGFAEYEDNPFPEGSKEYDSFERGFDAAERKLEKLMIQDGMT